MAGQREDTGQGQAHRQSPDLQDTRQPLRRKRLVRPRRHRDGRASGGADAMMRLARTALFLLFAAAVLYGLQHTRPLYSRITSPIVARGRMHERVDASTFALTIDRVRVARDLG